MVMATTCWLQCMPALFCRQGGCEARVPGATQGASRRSRQGSRALHPNLFPAGSAAPTKK